MQDATAGPRVSRVSHCQPRCFGGAVLSNLPQKRMVNIIKTCVVLLLVPGVLVQNIESNNYNNYGIFCVRYSSGQITAESFRYRLLPSSWPSEIFVNRLAVVQTVLGCNATATSAES